MRHWNTRKRRAKCPSTEQQCEWPLVVTTRSRHSVLFTADCRLTGEALLFLLLFLFFFSQNAIASSSFHQQLSFYGKLQGAVFVNIILRSLRCAILCITHATHTQTHTTHTHTGIHTHRHARTQAYTHTPTSTHAQAPTHTHIHRHARTHTPTQAHTQTHTTHTHRHARAHTILAHVHAGVHTHERAHIVFVNELEFRTTHFQRLKNFTIVKFRKKTLSSIQENKAIILSLHVAFCCVYTKIFSWQGR